MRYHFVLNGYLQNCQKLMQEMKSFKETYLSAVEEGVTYLYCQSEETARQLNGRLTENARVRTGGRFESFGRTCKSGRSLHIRK